MRHVETAVGVQAERCGQVQEEEHHLLVRGTMSLWIEKFEDVLLLPRYKRRPGQLASFESRQPIQGTSGVDTTVRECKPRAGVQPVLVHRGATTDNRGAAATEAKVRNKVKDAASLRPSQVAKGRSLARRA